MDYSGKFEFFQLANHNQIENHMFLSKFSMPVYLKIFCLLFIHFIEGKNIWKENSWSKLIIGNQPVISKNRIQFEKIIDNYSAVSQKKINHKMK